jgi:hypothetical protein
MADSNIIQLISEFVNKYGSETSNISDLLKTAHSKNITITDWNALVQRYGITEADVERFYSKLSTILVNISKALDSKSDTTVTNAKVDKVNLPMRLYGTKSDKAQTVYVLDKDASANSVPQRTPTGQVRVPLIPEDDTDAASKHFVENYRIATKGISYTISEDGTYYTVSSVSGLTDKDIVIPDTYNGLPVRVIGERVFRNYVAITRVHLPNSITAIGDNAFEGCEALCEINIPRGVTSVGARAFQGCTSLQRIVLPNTVSKVGLRAFAYCPGLAIYCEALGSGPDWDDDWNYSGCLVVWNVPLTFPDVEELLAHRLSNIHNDLLDLLNTGVNNVKNDLLNGAGPAYDTLKELGDALEENKDIINTLASKKFLQETLEEYDMTVVQKIASASDSLVPVTTNPNKVYGTDANGNQKKYSVTANIGWGNPIVQRNDEAQINVPLEQNNQYNATSKNYVDTKDNEVKAYADSRINPLEERVADLESLTLTFTEDISTAYEKAVPAEVGKYALVKMIGGATEKVPVTKNILNPMDVHANGNSIGSEISFKYNDDGTITCTFTGYWYDCYFSLWNFPVGRYYIYLENASIALIHGADIDISLASDYNGGDEIPETTLTFKVMVWQDTSVTTEDYEIVEAPADTVFEPYTLGFQDAEVERIESIGADGETLLGSIAIPFEAIKAKIDGFGKAVNDTYYDYIEFVDDKVFGYKVADEIVLNGTEAWQSNGSVASENDYFLTIVTSDKTKYIKDQALSDRYDYCKLTSLNKDTGINGYVSNAFGGFAVGVRPPNVTSYNPTSFRAFVKENPITVRLALTTPEVTDITDLFTEGNKLQVQQGGAIRFVNEKKMAIPNTVAFIKRKE